MARTGPTLRILGIRGLPAAHGGFETFADRLAKHLIANGWRVVVYCQTQGTSVGEDTWQGIERVNIPERSSGSVGSVIFDWQSIRHAARHDDLCLLLGYNTGLFWWVLRLAGVTNVANMDGVEWKRSKWPLPVRAWFWVNDWAGTLFANHLIADHPEIEKMLLRRVRRSKVSQIGYGGDDASSGADPARLETYGLESYRFLTVIARPEPENSILEMVRTFSSRKRGVKLVVLGTYDRTRAYCRQVLEAASDEVIFPGAIYDKETLVALRALSLAYMHGHQVGGTNPSLVEAIGASNPVIAHDNPFNRHVAADAALFFRDEASLDAALDELITRPERRTELSANARRLFMKSYRWETILAQYERLLLAHQPPDTLAQPAPDARNRPTA